MILHIADTPFAVVAVISACPLATAVITPFSSTVATSVLELFHVTAFSSVVSAGRYSTFTVCISPGSSFLDVTSNLIAVIGTSLTSTLQVLVRPFAEVAVTTASPCFLPVIVTSAPFAAISAILELSILHVIVLSSVVSAGKYSTFTVWL